MCLSVMSQNSDDSWLSGILKKWQTENSGVFIMWWMDIVSLSVWVTDDMTGRTVHSLSPLHPSWPFLRSNSRGKPWWEMGTSPGSVTLFVLTCRTEMVLCEGAGHTCHIRRHDYPPGLHFNQSKALVPVCHCVNPIKEGLFLPVSLSYSHSPPC